MSVSATTAAKKRRANNGSNPMFKSPSPSSEIPLQQNSASSIVSSDEKSSSNNIQRPMTLQQVITVFDNRLLNLEKSLLSNENTSHESAATTTTTVKSDIDREYIEKMHQDFHDSLTEQVSEFDHRHQLLAKEVIDLKHIVLKLQAYTLDVNKALIEERVHILTTDDDNNEPLQIQPDDILDLHSDLESMQQSMQADETTSSTHSLENISLSDKEESIEKQSTSGENIRTEIAENISVTVDEEDEEETLVEKVVSITE